MRDSKGRFIAGNTFSSQGGKARAQKLSKRRRRQIAKAGWAAFVTKYFDGADWVARQYMKDHARWAGDPFRDEPTMSFGYEYLTPAEWLAQKRDNNPLRDEVNFREQDNG